MKKSLGMACAIGVLLLTACGSSEQTPPQQVPAGETRSDFVKSVLESTTTFKDGSDIVIVSIAKGACNDLVSGMSKEDALNKATDAATNDEESKDRTTAFEKGLGVYCPEFS